LALLVDLGVEDLVVEGSRRAWLEEDLRARLLYDLVVLRRRGGDRDLEAPPVSLSGRATILSPAVSGTSCEETMPLIASAAVSVMASMVSSFRRGFSPLGSLPP
jgi:hypothetical protein